MFLVLNGFQSVLLADSPETSCLDEVSFLGCLTIGPTSLGASTHGKRCVPDGQSCVRAIALATRYMYVCVGGKEYVTLAKNDSAALDFRHPRGLIGAVLRAHRPPGPRYLQSRASGSFCCKDERIAGLDRD